MAETQQPHPPVAGAPANAKMRYEVRRSDLPLSCPLPVDGAVEFASARLPAHRGGRRRKPVPVLRRALRAGRLTHAGRCRPRAGRSSNCCPRSMRAVSNVPLWKSPTRWCAPAIARSSCPPAAGCVPRLTAVGAEHVTLDIGRKSPLTLRHVPTLRRLFAARTRRHRACAFAASAWLGWRAIAAACGADAPAFRDHRAWPEFALALQRDHDQRRARDLRLADGARLRAAALPAHRSGQAAR